MFEKLPKPQLDQFDIDAEAEAKAIGRMFTLRNELGSASRKGRKRCGNSRGGKIAMPSAGGGGNDYRRVRLQVA